MHSKSSPHTRNKNRKLLPSQKSSFPRNSNSIWIGWLFFGSNKMKKQLNVFLTFRNYRLLPVICQKPHTHMHTIARKSHMKRIKVVQLKRWFDYGLRRIGRANERNSRQISTLCGFDKVTQLEFKISLRFASVDRIFQFGICLCAIECHSAPELQTLLTPNRRIVSRINYDIVILLIIIFGKSMCLLMSHVKSTA